MIDSNSRSDFQTLVEVTEEAVSDCRELRFDAAAYSNRPIFQVVAFATPRLSLRHDGPASRDGAGGGSECGQYAGLLLSSACSLSRCRLSGLKNSSGGIKPSCARKNVFVSSWFPRTAARMASNSSGTGLNCA